MIRAGWQWAGVEGPVALAGPVVGWRGSTPTGCACCSERSSLPPADPHDDWDTYDQVMATERRVAVLVEPERVYRNG